MVSGGNKDRVHQHGLWQLIRVINIKAHMASQTMDANMALGGSMNQTPAWLLAISQNICSNMASGSSMDHGGFARRPNPENELFSILSMLPSSA